MRSDVDGLLAEFKTGRFVRPDWTKPNPIALARAISAFGGHCPWPEDAVVSQIGKRLGDADHLVVVIADGFGMNFVNALPQESFARTHLAWEQPAAFPSSTGPNLTSLYSGEYPAVHGFVGWWVYLPQIGERATVYEWVRTSDRADLGSLGVTPSDVFLAEPYPGKSKIDCRLFMPSALESSLPTLYSEAGGAPVEGFEDIADGVEKVANRLKQVKERSLTLLYWGLVDVSAHVYGVDAPETAESVNGLDAALTLLAGSISGQARLLVTADHGHLDVPRHVEFTPDHPLAKILKCTQSGDGRVNHFHVRDGMQERFLKGFRDEFQEDFYLFSTGEVVDLQLFGPVPPNDIVTSRLGDYTAISRAGAEMLSKSRLQSSLHRSTHGGLTVDEMMVPVLLA